MYQKLLIVLLLLIFIHFRVESAVRHFPDLEKKKRILERKESLNLQEQKLLVKLNIIQNLQYKLIAIEDAIYEAEKTLLYLEGKFAQLYGEKFTHLSEDALSLMEELDSVMQELKDYYNEYTTKYQSVDSMFQKIKILGRDEKESLKSKIDMLYAQKKEFISLTAKQSQEIGLYLDRFLSGN